AVEALEMRLQEQAPAALRVLFPDVDAPEELILESEWFFEREHLAPLPFRGCDGDRWRERTVRSLRIQRVGGKAPVHDAREQVRQTASGALQCDGVPRRSHSVGSHSPEELDARVIRLSASSFQTLEPELRVLARFLHAMFGSQELDLEHAQRLRLRIVPTGAVERAPGAPVISP